MLHRVLCRATLRALPTRAFRPQVLTRSKHIPVLAKAPAVPEVDRTPILLEDNVIPVDPEELTTEIELPKLSFTIPTLNEGDFVEIRRRNGQYSGIVISQRAVSGRRQALSVILRDGKIMDFTSDDVLFSIAGFVKSQNLGEDTATYSREIFNYQRSIKLKKGSAFQGLNRAYDYFIAKAASSNDDVTVTLQDISKVAFSTDAPTDEQLHIAALHLADDNLHYIPSRTVRFTQQWHIRSRAATEEIDEVVTAIRLRNEDYLGFLERAKKIVQYYDANVDVLGTLPKRKIRKLKVFTSRLTDADKRFINFIVDWIKSPETLLRSPHEVYAPTVLKGLGYYKDTFVDRPLAIEFLKQIGMFKPWDNMYIVQNASALEEFLWSDKAMNTELKLQNYAKAFLGEEKDTSGFYTQDPCDAIRHDFGDLPVYTIDDPLAKEIDDGVSIERIPGEDAAWLHVHIADPTAYIPPDHPLEDLMQQRVQTLYLPEQHFSMLPRELGELKFSLGESAQTLGNGSQYAFSFSAKLDNQGNVRDWRVRPSLVKNVKKIYYNDLDVLLKPHAPETKATDIGFDPDMTFVHPPRGADGDSKPAPSTVPKGSEKDLLDIYQLISKHFQFRYNHGTVGFMRPNPIVVVEDTPLAFPSIHYDHSSYASSLPSLRVSIDPFVVSPARQMVAETMIIGGRVVSHYAQEHGLVIPHRTQTWRSDLSKEDLVLRDEMMKARDPVTGMLPLKDLFRFMPILPPASATTSAGLPHALMGIPNGYCKATSPLRRYMDMIVHWQLKAHLLNQSRGPFDDRVQELIPRLETREKRMQFWQQGSLQFWVQEMIRRLEPDRVWTCMVSSPNTPARSELGASMEAAKVLVLDLGIKARITRLNRSLQEGEVVQARVVRNDQASGQLDFELV